MAIGSDERTLRREISRGNLTVTQVSPHRSKVSLDELHRFVAENPDRGWHAPQDASNGVVEPLRLVPNAAPGVESNVSAIVAGVANGLVTIPLEHYAQLVAARAELAFIREHFEFRWNGDVTLSQK